MVDQNNTGTPELQAPLQHLKKDIAALKAILLWFESGSEEHVCLTNFLNALLKGEINWVHIKSTNPAGVPKTGEHQTWDNQLANQVVQPLQYYYPRTLNDPADRQSISQVLQFAQQNKLRVKAAGSGHSYSDVATTPDLFINTHGLDKASSVIAPLTGQLSQADLRDGSHALAVEPIDWGDSYDPENNLALVETEAGVTLDELNKTLKERNVALENMGGYAGQTLIGATSTSTHGTGIGIGPFPSMVRSMVIATTGKLDADPRTPTNGVYLYRLEPAAGITDPEKYSNPDIMLIQDDTIFNASTCSMGCFGVIYSMVIEVMQFYYLHAVKTVHTLKEVVEMIQPDDAQPNKMPKILQKYRHFSLMVSPYPMKDEKSLIDMAQDKPVSDYYDNITCVLELKNIAPNPGGDGTSGKHGTWLGRIIEKFKLSFEATATLFNFCPKLIPRIVEGSLKSLKDDFTGPSPEVFVTGLSQYAGYSTEIGFPCEGATGDWTIEPLMTALDQVIRRGQNSRLTGQQYYTSPFAVRFVQKADALLSMMNGVNTAMIELDMNSGTYGGIEVMHRYQDDSYSLGGRPHWGLEFDHLTAGNNLMMNMYDKLPQWMGVFQQFNREKTFDNAFTDRVGFSNVDFKR